MTFKIDLHTHTSDFSHFIFAKINKKEYLQKILTKLFRKGDKIIVGVAEFNSDGRYSKLVETAKELSKDCIVEFGNEDYFISIKKGEKIIYFIRTDEIETDKGHILIIGNKNKIDSRNLSHLLKTARKKRWIVIADHPLHKTGLSYFLISKIFSLKKLSLDKKTLEKNKEYFSSLELNSYFPEDWKKIRSFARKNKIPLISDSDAHFIKEFFDSYFEMENLDFKNISKFKKSFKRELRRHIKIHPKKHEFIFKYKHGFESLFFGKILSKLGLIKK
ncbi:hypothetical protein J4474_03360 [Candidatus Pacearchaeota archaeon]|nr:hypothetical protein [Candidatus Pacearchaeota archaeon]